MKIKEVARVIGGATPSTKHPEYYDGGIGWATLKIYPTKVANISSLGNAQYLIWA